MGDSGGDPALAAQAESTTYAIVFVVHWPLWAWSRCDELLVSTQRCWSAARLRATEVFATTSFIEFDRHQGLK